jgi:hypothetical protein
VLELIATGLFVIVICTVATDDRAPWKRRHGAAADRAPNRTRGSFPPTDTLAR